jgi:hypothetical protein
MRLLALGLALLLCEGGIGAEESSHERTGQRKVADFELALDADATLRILSAEKGLNLGCNLGLECSWASTFSIALGLPLALRATGLYSAACRWGLMPGELGLDLGCSWKVGDWRLMAGLACGLPLARRDAAMDKAFGEPPGSGYATLGLALSGSRYLDPLVLGIGLKAESSLPRAELRGRSSIPLSLALVLSATEVLNERLYVTIHASPCLTSPRILAGAWEGRAWRYAFSAGCYLRLMFGDAGLRLGFADFSAPAPCLGFSRAFRSKQLDNLDK